MSNEGSVQIVVNPVSGRAGGHRLLAALYEILRREGVVFEVHQTRGAGDAAKAASHGCRVGARALVVAGGDGTVNDAVGGMLGDGVPMLVVPRGTENILAKYIGTRMDAEWLWGVIRTGREVRLDVGRMNGRRFLLVAGVGFDAEVVRRLSAVRDGHITYASYFWPIWRTLWSYRQPRLVVEADGEVIFEGGGLAIVGNVPRYAMGLRILKQAQPDDGLLDICVYRCGWQVPLFWHWGRTATGRHVGADGVTYRQAKRLRITSPDRADVEIDGDFAGPLPAEFEVGPERARILVAANWQASPVL